MRTAARLDLLQGYAFAELDRLRDDRRAAGADVIDFGVGDPVDPTPDVAVTAAAAGLEAHRRSGYPSYAGSPSYRRAVADWVQRRFGVVLDAESQVTASIGSKEAVFHLPLAFVDPGDVVLVPTPGYPPYVRGTQCAGGRAEAYPVREAGPVLPDLDSLPDELADRVRVVWITQPHVPTGRSATVAELDRLARQVRERSWLLCSDEAYSELWMDTPAASALETGTEDVLVFQSLSKRSTMTGYRVGFVAGDARAVAAFRRVKTNVDSGTPRFIEDAAVAALEDEGGPAEARRRYAERAEVLIPALRRLGCDVDMPEAGFYLWCRTPDGASGVEFARRLLGEGPDLAVMPGEWLAEPVSPTLDDGGPPPGQGRVRFALVPTLERCREAAARLAAWC